MLRYYNPLIAQSFAEAQTQAEAPVSGGGQPIKGKARRKRSRKRNKKRGDPSSVGAADVTSKNTNASASDAKVVLSGAGGGSSSPGGDGGGGGGSDGVGDAKKNAGKALRKLRKKLRQIQRLVEHQAAGEAISAQQQSKINTADDVRAAIVNLTTSASLS